MGDNFENNFSKAASGHPSSAESTSTGIGEIGIEQLYRDAWQNQFYQHCYQQQYSQYSIYPSFSGYAHDPYHTGPVAGHLPPSAIVLLPPPPPPPSEPHPSDRQMLFTTYSSNQNNEGPIAHYVQPSATSHLQTSSSSSESQPCADSQQMTRFDSFTFPELSKMMNYSEAKPVCEYLSDFSGDQDVQTPPDVCGQKQRQERVDLAAWPPRSSSLMNRPPLDGPVFRSCQRVCSQLGQRLPCPVSPARAMNGPPDERPRFGPRIGKKPFWRLEIGHKYRKVDKRTSSNDDVPDRPDDFHVPSTEKDGKKEHRKNEGMSRTPSRDAIGAQNDAPKEELFIPFFNPEHNVGYWTSRRDRGILPDASRQSPMSTCTTLPTIWQRDGPSSSSDQGIDKYGKVSKQEWSEDERHNSPADSGNSWQKKDEHEERETDLDTSGTLSTRTADAQSHLPGVNSSVLLDQDSNVHRDRKSVV